MSLRSAPRYAPTAAQSRFHRKVRRARFAVAVAGRRGGKTQAGAAEVRERILEDSARKLATLGPWRPSEGKDPKPWLRYCVVSPTYALLNEPKMALQAYLGMAASGGMIIEQGPTEWWLVGGIRIDFRSGDRPERLVSHGYDGIWLDEAARLKAGVWAENLRATLSDTQGWAIFTSTPLGRNWLYEQIWAKCDPKAAAEVAKLQGKKSEDILDPSFQGATWTTAENTALAHLAAEMAQAQIELPEEQFARNYRADFDVFPGQIFRLIEARHLLGHGPDMSRFKSLSAGIDIGSTHPTSCSLFGETWAGKWEEIETESAAGVLFDDSEDWARRKSDGDMWTSRVYRLLKRWAGLDWDRIPLKFPADRPDVRQQFEARGFNVESAFQEHEAAIAWFQTALHSGRVAVRSGVLWRCLTNIRRPDAGKRSTKAWVDENDDEWDGARYALSEPIASGEVPTRTSLTAMQQWGARR